MPYAPFNSETWALMKPDKAALSYVVTTPQGVTITVSGPHDKKVAVARAIVAIPELVTFVEGGIQFATFADLDPSAWESLEADGTALLNKVVAGEGWGPAHPGEELPDPVALLRDLLEDSFPALDDDGNRGFWSEEGLFYPSDVIEKVEDFLCLMDDEAPWMKTPSRINQPPLSAWGGAFMPKEGTHDQ